MESVTFLKQHVVLWCKLFNLLKSNNALSWLFLHHIRYTPPQWTDFIYCWVNIYHFATACSSFNTCLIIPAWTTEWYQELFKALSLNSVILNKFLVKIKGAQHPKVLQWKSDCRNHVKYNSSCSTLFVSMWILILHCGGASGNVFAV